MAAEVARAEDDEILRGLFLDPSEESFRRVSSMFDEWFGEYVTFKWMNRLRPGAEEINTGKYDLVIAEAIYPGELEDPRLAVRVITDQPGAADIPVIIITRAVDPELPLHAFKNGVYEYFQKQDLNRELMEYRMRNLLQREYRAKIISKQVSESLSQFQNAHGMSQAEIEELNSIVAMMKAELEDKFEEKMRLEAEKNRMQAVFGMYVDPTVVKGILNNEISVEQKGRLQNISILFADIRGYTTLSEAMQPEHVISFLNEYFTSMTEVIMGYNGMVDKYIGDGIMCLFGTPLSIPDHAENALQTAMEMQSVFDLWRGNWEQSYGIRPGMGIGIASGEAIVGNVGSFQKISYTAVGDIVNKASRLESLAGPDQVIITEEVYNSLSEEILKKFTYEKLEPVAIKGKSGKYQVYRVSDERLAHLMSDK